MELDINKFKEGCKTFTKNLRQILHNKITNDHPHSKNVSSGSIKGLLEDCQKWYDEDYKRVCVLLSEEYNSLIDKSDIFVDRIAEEDRRDFASQVVLVDDDIKDFNRIMSDVGGGEVKVSLFIHDVRKIMYEGEVGSVFDGHDRCPVSIDVIPYMDIDKFRNMHIEQGRRIGKTEAAKFWESTIGQKSYSLNPCDAGACRCNKSNCIKINNKMEQKINKTIIDCKNNKEVETDFISDGWHTFGELYEFRKMYNAVLFNEWARNESWGGQVTPKYSVHKSWKHYDGEFCFGEEGKWFIVSAMLPTGLISNHYKAEDWDLFQVTAVEKALFEFDGHTGEDVLDRLENLIKKNIWHK